MKLFLASAFVLATGHMALADEAGRVITLGGSVTEIAVALGAEDRLVARDTTSNYPESVMDLPDVGYIRALSPENVLALDPALIVAEGDAGPPEAVEVLKAAGIPFVLVPEATDPAGIVAKVDAVAAALNLPQQGAALAAEVRDGLTAAEARAAAVSAPKRVLFILSLQGGKVMAGGEGTEAEGIIRLARGLNALALGEAQAAHMGVDVQRLKRRAILAAAAATGAAVAVSGGIGFIGIIVPHLLRQALGPDHRALLPHSALLGASMVVLADLAARNIIAPAELPIGILTALIGAPVFLWMLLGRQGRRLRNA